MHNCLLKKLFLPDNQPITLKQIADESDLNKSTALRMTTTLLNEKFLSYNEETRKYQLGYCALALGISKLASIDLIEVSRPILEELVCQSDYISVHCPLTAQTHHSQTAVTIIVVNLVKKIVTYKFAGAIVGKSR